MTAVIHTVWRTRKGGGGAAGDALVMKVVVLLALDIRSMVSIINLQLSSDRHIFLS